MLSVYQGGAPSQHLFNSVEILLDRARRSAGCGVLVRGGDGMMKMIACLGYVDDIVLLATTPHMLQKAISPGPMQTGPSTLILLATQT